MKAKDAKVMSKAREIATTDLIHLTLKESKRFIEALQSPSKANEKLKQLFKVSIIR
jgi:uncharacterized protein (DUF1778 family)